MARRIIKALELNSVQQQISKKWQ